MMRSLVALLVPAVATAVALPQGQGEDDSRPFRPTIDSLEMIGSGCPIGSGGIVREIRDNTPVFDFSEWTLDLADAEINATSVDAFCTQEMNLSNSPAGYQVRIDKLWVSGWANLDPESQLLVGVQTELGGMEAGQAAQSLSAADLDGGMFEVTLDVEPDTWSACVGEDGVVPTIQLHIFTALRGTGVGSEISGGVLGGDSVVRTHFTPVWQQCA